MTAGGRCLCGQRLGPPWVLEAAFCGAVAAMLVGARSGLEVPAYLWFAALGVVLAVVDAAAKRLPNTLTALWAVGTLTGLAVPAVLDNRGGQWLRAVAAGVLLTVLFGLLAVLQPGAVGWGDVKAAGAVGVALGWLSWVAVYGAVLVAFVLAAGYAVTLLARRRAGRGTRVPFGPFLVTGALVLSAWLPAASG